MATTNPTGIRDGSTVTITLSAEQAERARTAVRCIVAEVLENYPEPWNNIAPFGSKEIDAWIGGLVALTTKYRGLLAQFEEAGVRDWSHSSQMALRAAWDRTGDLDADPDPLPPATTGPVTIIAEFGVLEEFAAELLSRSDDDHELLHDAACAIREQLA